MLRAVLADNFMEGVDSQFPPVIKFICDSFLFLPEQGCIKWDKLIDAIKNNTTYKMDWSPRNGECYIEVKDGMVFFAVSKYGDGCGGYLYVSIDGNKCLDAFESAQSITQEWMSK